MSEPIKFIFGYEPSPSDKGISVANTIIGALKAVPKDGGYLDELKINAGIIRKIEKRLEGNNRTVSLLPDELTHIRDRLLTTRFDVFIPAYLEAWERVSDAVESIKPEEPAKDGEK